MDYQEYMGMKIIGNPAIPEKEPVIKLSDSLNVSPEFRTKCNAWYLELFGEKSVAYVFSNLNCIAMNPLNVMALKKHAARFDFRI